MAGLLHKAALPDAGSLFQRRPARCWANERGLPPGNAAKKRPAFRSPTTPLEGGLRGHPAQAQGPGGGGEASELPHFLESSPVPRGPARRVLRGPGEPDNRRWLAQNSRATPSSPLDRCTGTESLPPQARILDSGPGSACPLG